MFTKHVSCSFIASVITSVLLCNYAYALQFKEIKFDNPYLIKSEQALLSDNSLTYPTKNTYTLLLSEQKDNEGRPLPTPYHVKQIVEYLEKATQLKFRIETYPWKRILEKAKQNQGIIFSIYKTPERLKQFVFSEPAFIDRIWLIKMCNKPMSFDNLSSLQGKTIGMVEGSSAGEAFDAGINKVFKVEYNNSSISARFSKLLENRMDAFLYYTPRSNAQKIQQEINAIYAKDLASYKNENKSIFCVIDKPVSTNDAYLAVHPHFDKAILDRINKALIGAKKDGSLNKILEQ